MCPRDGRQCCTSGLATGAMLPRGRSHARLASTFAHAAVVDSTDCSGSLFCQRHNPGTRDSDTPCQCFLHSPSQTKSRRYHEGHAALAIVRVVTMRGTRSIAESRVRARLGESDVVAKLAAALFASPAPPPPCDFMLPRPDPEPDWLDQEPDNDVSLSGVGV